MIPPKTDQRWKLLVIGDTNPEFSALPTKMLMMRLRLLAKDRTPQKVDEAITIAYDFFSKNASIVTADIELLFGNQKDSSAL
jgi:hypothetical protein